MSHSVLPPSSSARRIQCPRSTTLEAEYPEVEEGPDAAEGEAAHWAAAEQLAGRLCDVGQVAPNGVTLTEEMQAGADMLYDDVTKALAPYGLKPEQGCIERAVAIPRVHEKSWGTPDYFILLNQGEGKPLRLMLWDYKFGHRVVEVFENAQLVEYAAGITEGIHDQYPGVDITMTIVQPRSYHRTGPVRRWNTRLVDLRGLINRASNAAHEALGPEPRARVGPECRDCSGRHVCTELQRSGFHAMDEARRMDPQPLTPEVAALELRMVRHALQRLEARRSGLEAALEAELRAGRRVPGWALARKEGREKWTAPVEQIAALGTLFGKELIKPAEPITPRQARMAGLPEALVAQLAERTPGGMELIEDNGAEARRVFG